MNTIENKIKKQQKEASDAILQEMGRKGDNYFELIVTEPNSQIKRLPESTFVRHFLPYFCGEKQINGQTNTLGLWIGIAGAITSKVDIVNNTGEVLFTVPPINDTSIFDVNNLKNAQGFKNIIQNFQLYANQTPASGQNYLSRTLDSRLDKLRSESKTFTENEKAWMDIFKRYGKVKGNFEATVAKADSIGADEMIYD